MVPIPYRYSVPVRRAQREECSETQPLNHFVTFDRSPLMRQKGLKSLLKSVENENRKQRATSVGVFDHSIRDLGTLPVNIECTSY